MLLLASAGRRGGWEALTGSWAPLPHKDGAGALLRTAQAAEHMKERTAGSQSEPVLESGHGSVINSFERILVPIITWAH